MQLGLVDLRVMMVIVMHGTRFEIFFAGYGYVRGRTSQHRMARQNNPELKGGAFPPPAAKRFGVLE